MTWKTLFVALPLLVLTSCSPGGMISNNSKVKVPLSKAGQKYVNDEMGFSIVLPRTRLESFGGCERRSDGTFEPKEELVPVSTFQDQVGVIIANDYYYSFPEESKQGKGYRIGSCIKVRNSAIMQNRHSELPAWRIIIGSARDLDEVNAFVKKIYGPGCRYGGFRNSPQDDVQDIVIMPDSKFSEYECTVRANRGIAARYSETYGKVAFIHQFGQPMFRFSSSSEETYDEDVVNSFRLR